MNAKEKGLLHLGITNEKRQGYMSTSVVCLSRENQGQNLRFSLFLFGFSFYLRLLARRIPYAYRSQTKISALNQASP